MCDFFYASRFSEIKRDFCASGFYVMNFWFLRIYVTGLGFAPPSPSRLRTGTSLPGMPRCGVLSGGDGCPPPAPTRGEGGLPRRARPPCLRCPPVCFYAFFVLVGCRRYADRCPCFPRSGTVTAGRSPVGHSRLHAVRSRMSPPCGPAYRVSREGGRRPPVGHSRTPFRRVSFRRMPRDVSGSRSASPLRRIRRRSAGRSRRRAAGRG